MTTGKPLVLHVTECYDGGVSRAIRTIVNELPIFNHAIIYSGNDSDFPDSLEFISKYEDSNFLLRALILRKFVNQLKPDILHLHSSWAGVYGRLLRSKTFTIYQPHCYKFDDPSISRTKAWLFHLAEKLLSYQSDLTLVLSDHEEKLSRSLNRNKARVFLPNIPSVPIIEQRTNNSSKEKFRIIMVGRTSHQKDPQFFINVKELCDQIMCLDELEFRWVGGGTELEESKLIEAGISVSGWVSGDGLVAEIDEADLYVHTALYEGFPLSLLDAAARRVPVIARNISALEGSGLWLGQSPRDMAEKIMSVFTNRTELLELQKRNDALLRRMNRDAQIKVLTSVYREGMKS